MPNALSSPQVYIDIPGSIGRGLQNAGAIRQMQSQNAMRPLQQQILEQEVEKNALNLSEARRKQPALVEQERAERMAKKYGGQIFELQRQYMEIERLPEQQQQAALAKLNQAWAPVRDEMRKDADNPAGIPDEYPPALAARFLDSARQIALMRNLTLADLGVLKATTQKEVAKTKEAGKAKRATDKATALNEILGPYKKWATDEPDRWAIATDIAAEGYAMGRDKFAIQKAIGEKISSMDAAQLEEMRSKKKTGGWGDFVLGLFGRKKGETAPAEESAGSSAKPPKGAVDTGRTSGGKPVWKLPNGDYWIESSVSRSRPTNLAMNAESVPLGTGMANRTKTDIQLRKELNKAYLDGDDRRIKEIEDEIRRRQNQMRNVG